MENYLFIDKEKDEVKYGEVYDKELKTYFLKRNRNIEPGDIFRCRIVKKVLSLNCFFVELFKDVFGFLDFKDVIGNVKLGDFILVEVYKINLENKAPNVSMNISISSLFSVIYYKNVGVIKARGLKNLVPYFNSLKNLQFDFGVKIRSSCIFATEQVVLDDINNAIKTFKKILSLKNDLPTPKLIYRKDYGIANFLLKNPNKKCIVNDKDLFLDLKKNTVIKNEFIFDDSYKLIYDYNVGRYVEGLKKNIVDFNNINIVIESFKSLTFIDVNSKKGNFKDDKSKNSFYVNTLALNEIVRQISFRDISGNIVIDFINMNFEEKYLFEKNIKKIKIFDERNWTFHGFTKMGLYEISRQRR